MTTTRDQVIVGIWEESGSEVVRTAELNLIHDALAERFGSDASPASIARILAEHGARLGHPEILQADMRWRERQHLFMPEDLAFDTMSAANAFIDKLEILRQTHDQQSLRQAVQRIKQELDLLATKHAVARETAQWLTVWLQNPQIFDEWLDLRRSTKEFQELFGTFSPSHANTDDRGLTSAHEPEKRTQR